MLVYAPVFKDNMYYEISKPNCNSVRFGSQAPLMFYENISSKFLLRYLNSLITQNTTCPTISNWVTFVFIVFKKETHYLQFLYSQHECSASAAEQKK